ncbi:hypothetical protein SAMN04489867_0726 [Pedococcus dokdonensis]|uniref:DUF2157 domain-containing protein n=1 Tax=Pedococcus dokdonensis TaxID=443156 RepID=A0A1H0MUK2_9MICO|nr:hypothetical protein [Pedococcus dokdonensis]SDO84148.1 hypothetical protein SAMN04489867_0726 [Pedococcus dokdonensis]
MSPIPCPACSRFLPDGAAACPGCHLSLTGPDAARLWQVDQGLAALQRERTVLIAALRGQGADDVTQLGPQTGPTVATTAGLPAGLPTGSGAVPPPARPAPPVADTAPRRSWTTQQTLLAVGVLLVLVAGSIALAIAWFLIGIVGQLLVMGGFTAAATVAALVLSRRRLPSSAEALALVAGGLLLLDLAAARRFGLAGLDTVDARTYVAVTGLLAALVLAALHRTDRRIAGFALLSLTAASVGWGGVVAFASDGAGVAALALLGALLFAVVRLVVPSSFGLTARAATGPAAGWTAIAAAAAAAGALGAGLDAWSPGGDARTGGLVVDALTADGLASVGLLAVLTVGGAGLLRWVVVRRASRLGSRAAVRADWATRPLSGDWRALGVVAAVATGAGPTAVLGLALQLGALWSALLAVLAGVVGTALAVTRTRTTSIGAAWVEAQVGAALGVLVLVCAVTGSRPATIVALTAAALTAGTLAVHRATWRPWAATVCAVASVAATSLLGSVFSDTAAILVAGCTGAAWVAVSLVRRTAPEEAPLAVVGHLATLLALLVAVATGSSDTVLIVLLTTLALTSAATAVLRPALRAVASGTSAVALVAALWLSGGLVGPRSQWVVLAAAALALAAAANQRRPHVEEPVLGILAVLVATASVVVALDRSWPHAAALAATTYGLVAVGYAALPRRRAVVTVAVAALTTAVWVELWDADVTTVEAFTLPMAAFLLAAGLWSHREFGDHSWLTAGPALAVALVPSTLLSTVDDGLVRPLLTVAAGAAVLALGALRRWQAPVVLGAAAAAVVALTQLMPYAVLLPRYLTLGALGVALLAIGARYEQRRADARQAVSWLASMS